MPTPYDDFTPGSDILLARQEQAIQQTKEETFEQILNEVRSDFISMRRSKYNNPEEVNNTVMDLVKTKFPGISYSLSDSIVKELIDELQGFGPIAELIEAPDVSDVVIVHSKLIYYQKDGQTYLYEKGGVPVGFKDIGRLRMLIEKLCMLGYARIDESNPGAVFSAQGMRITALIPPIYCVGDNECTIAIRKFVTVPTLKEMIKQGSISEPAAIFMEHAARGKMTIGFAGPMNSGKTTQIAVLGRYFDPMELPLLIEPVHECPIDIPNLRRAVCRPPNMEGRGEITFEQLFRLALTSNGTRILITETTGGELFFILQAANAGHDGVIFTFHADNAHDALLSRLPTMLMQNHRLNKEYNPFLLIRSIHFICVMEKYHGLRRYKEISEVCFNYKTGECEARPVFLRESEDGELVPTGYIPENKLDKMDYHLREMGYPLLDRKIFAT